jgi:hypothetical protein
MLKKFQYAAPYRPEHLEVEPEDEVDEDEKGYCILQSEVEKAIKEIRDKKATEMMMYLEMYSNCWTKMVSD